MVSAKAEVKSTAKSETQSSSTSQTESKTQSTSQSTTQTQSKATVETSAKVEAQSEAQSNTISGSEALTDDQMMIDNEAMIGFSMAIQNGVNIMDLPDPNNKIKEEPQLNDQNTMFAFQEHVNSITNVKDDEPPPLEEEVKTIPVQEPPTIASIAAQIAQDQAEGIVEAQMPDDDAPPSETQMQAQSALDEVKIILPEGMDIQDHSAPPETKSIDEDSDIIIKRMQESNEANHFKDPRRANPLTQIQSEAQAALDYVTVKDPFEEQTKDNRPHSHMMHILESNLPKETHSSQQDLDVSSLSPVSLRASKLDGITNEDKQMDYQQKKTKETEIERSIKAAEYSQNDHENLLDNQAQLDTEIAGSNDLWGSQFEMEHITGKLTRPKDFKSQAQKDKETHDAEKEERQRIRMELLAPTPIDDADVRLFSDSLSTKASYSKSEDQLADEKRMNEQNKRVQDEEDRKKLAEIQAQNKRLIKQQSDQEQAQIKQAEFARISKKNDQDLKSLQELKSLSQMGSANGLTQLSSLADQAAMDETVRQDNAEIQQSADAITQVAQKEYVTQTSPNIPLKSTKLPKKHYQRNLAVSATNKLSHRARH